MQGPLSPLKGGLLSWIIRQSMLRGLLKDWKDPEPRFLCIEGGEQAVGHRPSGLCCLTTRPQAAASLVSASVKRRGQSDSSLPGQ